jgi:lipoprotein-anchoring transpeptidase ErfK/SrfK
MRAPKRSRLFKIILAIEVIAAAALLAGAAKAGPLDAFAMIPPGNAQLQQQPTASDPPAADLPNDLQRQVVSYRGSEAPGTLIIDTPHTYLYLVLGNGRAMRYGIGVGREGFTWSGTRQITKKSEWPDWNPPPEMIARQPYLPRFVAGGPGNPLGARAMYLGGTQYRIHGTNDPTTIGKQVSSGCIRMTNEDVTDLYSRVGLGAKVVVLPMSHRADAANGRRS